MLLQIKIYIIGFIYFLGILFMILFPPRNYEQSGTKMRKVRSSGNNLKYMEYIDHETMLGLVEHMALEDPEMAQVVHLTPRTTGNNSLIALELHSDTHSKKPGILIIATLNGMVWSGPNVIIELAEKLLYDTNYQTPFFNDYDWYLIPIANPDALYLTTSLYKYAPVDAIQWSSNTTARTKTRPSEWHKNTDRETFQGSCFGTNINRNFAYHWQEWFCERRGCKAAPTNRSKGQVSLEVVAAEVIKGDKLAKTAKANIGSCAVLKLRRRGCLTDLKIKHKMDEK